jgi:hypothetical protein
LRFVVTFDLMMGWDTKRFVHCVEAVSAIQVLADIESEVMRAYIEDARYRASLASGQTNRKYDSTVHLFGTIWSPYQMLTDGEVKTLITFDVVELEKWFMEEKVPVVR